MTKDNSRLRSSVHFPDDIWRQASFHTKDIQHPAGSSQPICQRPHTHMHIHVYTSTHRGRYTAKSTCNYTFCLLSGDSTHEASHHFPLATTTPPTNKRLCVIYCVKRNGELLKDQLEYIAYADTTSISLMSSSDLQYYLDLAEALLNCYSQEAAAFGAHK